MIRLSLKLFPLAFLLAAAPCPPATAQTVSGSAASYGLMVAQYFSRKHAHACEFPLQGSWPDEAAAAVARFGGRLLQKAREANYNGNVVFSPLSLSSAFALVYFGAKGQTRQELEDVFGFQGGRVPSMLGKKSALFGERSAQGARVANRVYLSEDVSIEKCYAAAVSSESIQLLNFAGDPVGSRNLINNYVGRVTNGQIQDMIPDGLISYHTQMVLANAVYFQGAWAAGFPKDLTQKKIFRSVHGDQEVDFMSFRKEKALNYQYISELQSEIIELPYKDGKFSMFILFPNSPNGWRDVERKLSSIDIQTLFSSQDKWSLLLQLPKWKMDMELQGVQDHLATMGLSSVFSSSADLSGITLQGNHMITDVVHKAKIIVDEEGTTAAAATAVITSRTVYIPEYFIVDHPFLFFIVDKSDNMIFFQGTVTSFGHEN